MMRDLRASRPQTPAELRLVARLTEHGIAWQDPPDSTGRRFLGHKRAGILGRADAEEAANLLSLLDHLKNRTPAGMGA